MHHHTTAVHQTGAAAVAFSSRVVTRTNKVCAPTPDHAAQRGDVAKVSPLRHAHMLSPWNAGIGGVEVASRPPV